MSEIALYMCGSTPRWSKARTNLESGTDQTIQDLVSDPGSGIRSCFGSGIKQDVVSDPVSDASCGDVGYRIQTGSTSDEVFSFGQIGSSLQFLQKLNTHNRAGGERWFCFKERREMGTGEPCS